MITSSHFFEKSFFTFDPGEERIQLNDVSPWGKPMNNQKYFLSPVMPKKKSENNKGYQLSRKSSLKYIEKKLKAKSNLNRSRQLQPIAQYKQYSTIQQSDDLGKTKHCKYAQSIEIISRVKRQKKKSQLFPEITINQYNDIKAKGSGLMNYANPVQQILQRRKNRRKILQEFGKGTPKHSRKKEKKQQQTSSLDGKEILSGRYVCIAKNPQFSVNGFPTTKLLDQY